MDLPKSAKKQDKNKTNSHTVTKQTHFSLNIFVFGIESVERWSTSSTSSTSTSISADPI